MDAGLAVSILQVGATKGTTLTPWQHLRSTRGRTGTSRSVCSTALATTLLLGAAPALSACGAAQEAGAAAIVNGTVISDQDVQTVAGQLNKISPEGQKLSSSNALLSLILAPYVLAEAKQVDKAVSVSDARKVIQKVADPAPKTIAFVQMQLALQGLDEASRAAVVKKIGQAKITVNPRYGTFDATAIAITPTAPNWIKASAPQPAK